MLSNTSSSLKSFHLIALKTVTSSDGDDEFELDWVRDIAEGRSSTATSFAIYFELADIAIYGTSSSSDIFYVATTNSYGYYSHNTYELYQDRTSALFGSTRSSDCSAAINEDYTVIDSAINTSW